MHYKYICFFSAFACSLSLFAIDTLLDHKINKVMEEMDLPEMGAKRLASQNKFTDKYFKQAITEMHSSSIKLRQIKHPDKEFRAFAEMTLQQLQTMQNMIKAKKTAKELKQQWHLVENSCNSCHTIYRK